MCCADEGPAPRPRRRRCPPAGVAAARSRVWWWQTVTVAFAPRADARRGSRRRGSVPPSPRCGPPGRCRGGRAGSAPPGRWRARTRAVRARRPRLTGFEPSTSLPGSTPSRSAGVGALRQRRLQDHAVHRRVGGEVPEDPAGVVRARPGSDPRVAADPAAAAAWRWSARTRPRSRRGPRTTASRGARPARPGPRRHPRSAGESLRSAPGRPAPCGFGRRRSSPELPTYHAVTSSARAASSSTRWHAARSASRASGSRIPPRLISMLTRAVVAAARAASAAAATSLITLRLPTGSSPSASPSTDRRRP